jgi:hypothetical protein
MSRPVRSTRRVAPDYTGKVGKKVSRAAGDAWTIKTYHDALELTGPLTIARDLTDPDADYYTVGAGQRVRVRRFDGTFFWVRRERDRLRYVFGPHAHEFRFTFPSAPNAPARVKVCTRTNCISMRFIPR